MSFQRARNDEQREIRRRAILDTAAAMLDEMPVADVGLNELSRRVGLAKSNVLRYFESREAVLLELLDYFLRNWLAELAGELAAGVDPGRPAVDRAGRLADVLSRSLADRPVLCDLFNAQGGVLEHNVSVEVVRRHKRDSLESLGALAELVRRHVPELGDGATFFCLQVMVLAGALSAYSPPPASVLAVYEADPALAVFHLDLHEALRITVTTTILGALPRV
ncbi:TetR/AcrR family transcriptional regulator [Paractinoplanes rishiriensis]|uniref:TetR family transcriptional regulator n=1 Tax=Paractinoplanes rishiriensis TaxID=1050105 RepID=A0A919JSX3_9ACTN|nr:TetR family transcriptional regulator [Actinoplanes rishiriensis]GIE92734.1 TetR family transcriptional regulator [Actinoplanes rishiriensis]